MPRRVCRARPCSHIGRAINPVAAPAHAVERLEPRALLAAVAWDGGGLDGDWHNPLNWAGDVLPAEDDDVTIGPDALPAVRITAGNTARVQSLDLAKPLAIWGELDVTGSTRFRAVDFVHIFAGGTATTANLTADAGGGGISVYGVWAVSGGSHLDADLIIAGRMTVEGTAIWTGGPLALWGEGSRLVVSGELVGRFDAGRSVQITGEGVLEVPGTFRVDWNSNSRLEGNELLVLVDVDVTGHVAVLDGTALFQGEIAQLEVIDLLEGTIPHAAWFPENEQSIRLTGGSWHADNEGVLDLGVNIDWNSAHIIIGSAGRFKGLAERADHGRQGLLEYILYNDGTIHFNGKGQGFRGAHARVDLLNAGTVISGTRLTRTLRGGFYNYPVGSLEVRRGTLALRVGDHVGAMNDGRISIGAANVGSHDPTILHVKGGSFIQRASGTLEVNLGPVQSTNRPRFTSAALIVNQHATLDGLFTFNATGTPASSTTDYRFQPVRYASRAGEFATVLVNIDLRTGEFFYTPRRLVVRGLA